MSDSNASYKKDPEKPTEEDACVPCHCTGGESSSESKSSGIPLKRKVEKRRVSLKQAKLILKRPSAFTMESIYDHLVSIVERVIDERPVNVTDYFEQYSRDVRVHKNRLSDITALSMPSPPEFLILAKAILKSLKFGETEEINEEASDTAISDRSLIYLSSTSSMTKAHRILSKQENVIQLQHFWALCGLGFQIDEVFQLSWVIQKIQNHHSIRTARFWGKIYGSHASYYVVEAEITKTERMLRIDYLEDGLVTKMIEYIKRRIKAAEPPDIDPDLIPGYTWQHFPLEDLLRMQSEVAPVPRVIAEEQFEMPPEPYGTGLNRKTYFVTNVLSEEWKELPKITPKQVTWSRKIRKCFTGHPDAKLSCYPAFPGTEKNYLRAMIARITAGSYIAPNGYFRKMTKKEIRALEREGMEYVFEGEEEAEEEEDSDIEDEFPGEVVDNDWPVIEDERYKPYNTDDLKQLSLWVHYRPYILNQGTVVYIDEESVIKNLVRVALRKIKEQEYAEMEGEIEVEQESDIEHDIEDELGEEEELKQEGETGPELFAPADDDLNLEDVEPWSVRTSEHCNSVNQCTILRSNLWPGAYSFISGKWCDSIYLGWGTKYVARCSNLEHLPDIQNLEQPDIALEATDPTPEMEERWRLYYMKKDVNYYQDENTISIETDKDEEDED